MKEVIRIYKPELSNCPLCNSKLVYRYTTSNKVIQFSNGKKFRIKNLGYSCPNLECKASDTIFTSQTASKFCIKGYTYSAKVITLITILKEKGWPREKICAHLELMGIEISDRNIDNIAQKEELLKNENYLENIKREYDFMIKHYGQIRISIDSLVVSGIRAVSIRDSFHNHQIGVHYFKNDDLVTLKKVLSDYVKDPNLKCITTVRKNTTFFECLKETVDRDMEYIHFIKY